MAPVRKAFAYETSAAVFLFIFTAAFVAATPDLHATDLAPSQVTAYEQDPQALVREVIHNELTDEADDTTHWRFRKTDVTGGISKTWDVVQTKHGEVQRLIAINGHPLTRQQEIAEEARIQNFLRNSEEQQKRKAASSSDFKQQQALMRLLPNALTYRYAGEEDGLIHLTFTPNPNFHASTREAEVFHHMSGDFFINKSNMRLAEFDGRITSRVEFGWGLLGHLNKGGTFNVKQAEVAKDHWDLTLLQTNITGKVLFFHTITVQEKLTEYDYHRVPDDLTLRQGADLLEQSNGGSVVLSASSTHSNS